MSSFFRLGDAILNGGLCPDLGHFDAMNEVYGGFFADDRPPERTTVEADIAIPNAEMEVSPPADANVQ